LEDLMKTHTKCISEVLKIRPVITMIEGEEKAKTIMVDKDDVYLLECEDISDDLLEDAKLTNELLFAFDDVLIDELEDAVKVIMCTLKKRKLKEEEKKEMSNFWSLKSNSF